MSLALRSSVSAMSPGLTTSFLGVGGLEPYTYAVLASGAGGSINASTGLYTAPLIAPVNPALSSDTVQVTDDNGDTATLPILITSPLGLFCEIIQKEMGLAQTRVYLWDQKIMQPKDSGLYIAVSVLTCKPFANSLSYDSTSGIDAIQSINMVATLSIDAISRGPEALNRKEEILLALASQYSQSQQDANSFNIGKLPIGGQFINLSNVDGAAIPYRFNISVNIQYFVRKVKAVPYFDTFADVDVITEP